MPLAPLVLPIQAARGEAQPGGCWGLGPEEVMPSQAVGGRCPARPACNLCECTSASWWPERTELFQLSSFPLHLASAPSLLPSPYCSQEQLPQPETPRTIYVCVHV